MNLDFISTYHLLHAFAKYFAVQTERDIYVDTIQMHRHVSAKTH